MKKLLTLLLLLAVASAHLPVRAQYTDVREQGVAQNVPYADIEGQSRTLFNFGWQFCLDGDATWRDLDLPHDFQWERPWNEDCGGARGFKPMCAGTYRKTFAVPAEWQGRQVVLDFQGVMYHCDVKVNGTLVAQSEYGYLGFEADVSKHLNYGGDNTVEVWASTGKKNGSRWYTGGGIYRDVNLCVRNATHIARHGIYVSTPSVTDAQATVQVTVDVAGFKKKATTVRAIITDAEGNAIAEASDTMNQLTKHTHDELPLPLMTIAAPHRWDIDTPYLYNVEVQVWADGVMVDRQTDRFGVRTLEWGTDFGFRLNGRKVFLQGMANHHDLGALGAAAFDRALERQLRQMKAFGYNSIRCSHNPYSEALYRLCDEIGLLVVDELIDKWSDGEYWGGRKPFTQLWPSLIQEWVTRDRNHPCVIMWSLGNELQTRTNWSGYDTNDWGITTYNIFNQVVKRYDPTRKTTVAQFPARAGGIREEPEFKTYFAPPELGCATEVNSFNYQWPCYPDYFKYCPGLILYQSEATTNQMLAPYYGMDRARTVGLAYWGAIEYWGEADKWPKKGWNYSYFSHTLEPFPQAYLIKGAFQPQQPVVRIGVAAGAESVAWNGITVGQKRYSEFWNCTEGSTPTVVTFTNAQEVELLVNGKSLGRQSQDTADVYKRGMVTWSKVPYDKGGTLTAVAYNDGVEVARHQISTAGKASKLVATPENPDQWRADGMDLQYIAVRAVDSKGRQVPGFADDLTVTVEGEATLVALDNADHYTDLLFGGIDTKPMQNGYMLVILRSTRTAGRVKVTCKTKDYSTTQILKTK